MIFESSRPRILVCPLNWGLGHAGRCVPLIRELLSAGAEVLIAADKGPADLLGREFPELELIRFPGAEITYPDRGSMAFAMMLQSPRILKSIHNENRQLTELIKRTGAHAVISDNRFGCFNPEVYSVFMTHQVYIQAPDPLSRMLLYRINRSYMKHYREVWIPDFPNAPGLSGNLAHPQPQGISTYYIGALSRFTRCTQIETAYDVAYILSGPEPQRSLLEKCIVESGVGETRTCLLVRGTLNAPEWKDTRGIRMRELCTGAELQDIFSHSALIVCRSGYSSIMDLYRTGKPAVLIPTPGQTEQEYLAHIFSSQGIFPSYPQKSFNPVEHSKIHDGFSGFSAADNGEILRRHVADFIQRLKT